MFKEGEVGRCSILSQSDRMVPGRWKKYRVQLQLDGARILIAPADQPQRQDEFMTVYYLLVRMSSLKEQK